MEGFHDVFNHPHEFIIRGRWNHALCNKVANGRRDIAETEQKHCRGTPYEVFQREGFPSDEPCHVIGVREGEAAWVLPRRLGS